MPFSNTLPALATLCLTSGMVQRDGYFIVLGYLALLGSFVYFGLLALIVLMGGHLLLG